MKGEELESLVAEFVERCERGEGVSADEFARAHPQHEDALRERLRQLGEIEGMFPRAPAPEPRVVGDWRVIRSLGSGGGGQVYEVEGVHQEGTRRALKLLHGGAALSERQATRFEREAAALKSLDLDGVVRVHEVGAHEGVPFIVMERIDGPPLSALIAGQSTWPGVDPRSHSQAVELVAKLAETLEQVHQAGLTHRDLKPSNVLMDREGRPVLIDFGLVRATEATALTGSGDLLGTPHFMAPEQAAGLGGDLRVDVYGLGAILYQLLTNELPHAGDGAMEVVRSASRRLPVAPRVHDPSIPRALEDVVRRAMAFDPEDRFQTAQAVAEALRGFASGQPQPGVYPQRCRWKDAWRWHRKKIAVAGIVLVMSVVGIFFWKTQWEAFEAGRKARIESFAQSGVELRLGGLRDLEEYGLELVRLGADDLGGYFMNRDELGPVAQRLREGDELMARDQPEQAADAYLGALALGAADGAHDWPQVLASGLAGLALFAAGDLDRAAQELTAVHRVVPTSRVTAKLAAIHVKNRQWQRAAEAFEQAAAGQPPGTAQETLHDAAMQWVKAGDQERALETLSQALMLVEGEVPAAYERTRAACLGDPAAAERILRRLVVAHPRSPSLRYNLGLVRHKQHELSDAAEHYRKALLRRPNDVGSLSNLAWIHGGLDDDCAACRACLSEHPELLDAAAAEECACRALHVVGGSRPGALSVLHSIAVRVGFTEALAATADAYLADPPAAATDGELGVLLRFCQKLR